MHQSPPRCGLRQRCYRNDRGVFVTVLSDRDVLNIAADVRCGRRVKAPMACALSCTVLLVLAQLITGAVVSTMFTVWLHCELFPHASIAAQVRVASNVLPQCPVVLVTVLIMVMVTLLLTSVAVGASKRPGSPELHGFVCTRAVNHWRGRIHEVRPSGCIGELFLPHKDQSPPRSASH